jgi:hypothetical protein
MDIPVFDLKNLRRYFYNFLIFCILIALASTALMFAVNLQSLQLWGRINTWYIIIPLVAVNYLYGVSSKKELNKIIEITDYEEKFRKYETRFVKRLIWNAFSLVVTGVLLIITQKNIFLYILILQMVLLPLFYPRRAIIAKELKNEEIVFT